MLVLEDMQWGDAATGRLLDGTLRHAIDQPLFVLAVGRGEMSAALGSFVGSRYVTRVEIGELSRRAAEDFVGDVLGTDADARVRDLVVQRASGNAFFLEELVRRVADGHGSDLPSTVIAMLQSRIAALAPEARRVLRAASIFGNSFWPSGVAHLLGGATSDEFAPTLAESGERPKLLDARTGDLGEWIKALVAEELVERRRDSRFPGQSELAFRQATLREAVNQMLTARDREVGHRLAAMWLEMHGETDPLVLGEHFERGGVLDRAAHYLARAAEQALEGHDFGGAIALIERALAALGPDPEARSLRGSLKLMEAEAHRWRGDFTNAEARAVEAVDLLPRGEAPWFRALDELMTAAGRRGHHLEAGLWKEVIANASYLPSAAGSRIVALASAGRRLFQAGDYFVAREIVRFVESEIAGSSTALEPKVLAEVCRLRGAEARHMGDVGADIAGYEEAVAAFETAGDTRSGCNARASLGFAYIEIGDYATARAELERSKSEADRLNLGTVRTRAEQNLGWVLAHEGRLEEARAMTERVAAAAHAEGNFRFEAWTRIYLSRILDQLGEGRAAEREAAAAATALAETPPAYASAIAARSLALVGAGQAVEAQILAGEAMAVLEGYEGIEEFESLVWLAAIRSNLAAGDEEEARSLAVRAAKRLAVRAALIQDPTVRASFLDRVPENLALAQLARDLAP